MEALRLDPLSPCFKEVTVVMTISELTSKGCKCAGLIALTFLVCGQTAVAGATTAGDVTGQRLQADASVGSNWMMYGRTYNEQRFSPLKQINADNVRRLGIAWSIRPPSPDGLSTTPIVVDGVIYMSGSQDLVEALDAGSGRTLWSWRPASLDLTHPFVDWTSRFNRGVALWKGSVFIATGDCRLFALSAATGREIWEVKNCDPTQGYGSDGAPRVAKNMVLIGSGGADTGARGYVSAYDTRTGRLLWRFYTVPGDPAKRSEQPILKMAAKTWQGKEWWKTGGGTVEDSIVYDPELNRVYFGTDTAIPWGQIKGDALFTCSIVAVDADTGRYLWHYQEVSDDAWDYEATAQIVLTNLTIGGKPRKVLMQAAKDGFFYVLDRETGKLLSATPFVKVTWASRVDPVTGRPVLTPDAQYYLHPNGKTLLWPGIEGARFWQAISFSPLTGLVYIPALNTPSFYNMDQGGLEIRLYFPPPSARIQPEGRLIAWDPVAQRARWSARLKYPFNGGTLVTAGNLVFEGTAEGVFTAHRATDGRLVWSMPVVTATQAPPVTYLYHGTQYVLLPVGPSGDVRAVPEYGDPPSANGPSRLIAFALGAHGTIPKGLIEKPPQPTPPPRVGSSTVIALGDKLYNGVGCVLCHGMQMDVEAGGTVPDLRYLPQAAYANWNGIVIDGARAAAGMPPFKGALSPSDAQAIRAYVIDQAWKLYDSTHTTASRAGALK
jgi:quinohemoprotein ethanol dehydrogenase